jgi:hypothetical protein
MALHSLTNSVWLAGLVLQVALGIVLVGRRLLGQYPMFGAYSLFGVCETAVLYAVHQNPSVYFYAYIVGESVSVILGLALVREVFAHLFSSYPALRQLALTSFRVTVLLLAVLGGAVIYAKMPIGKSGIAIALVVVEEAARILEVGLITFLFLFSSVFGLHWRQIVFGITLGLGLFTLVELFGLALRPYVGPAVVSALNLAHVFAFDCSVLIWISYSLARVQVPGVSELPKTVQLEQWNQAIMELIHQ